MKSFFSYKPFWRIIVFTFIIAITTLSLFWFLVDHETTSPTIKHSYYHWAQTYKNDTELINSHAPHQLYIKLLGIGYRQKITINPTRLNKTTKGTLSFKYPHHITQRGNRREDVFFSKEDRQFYLEWLGVYCQK